MQPKPRRPTGVTILGVLAILGGIVLLVAGVAAIGLGLVIGTYAGSAFTNALSNAGYSGLASIGAGTIAVILLALGAVALVLGIDRKSTRLNSSHTVISYAVFCLK